MHSETRQMSISHAEFLRSLAPLARHYDYDVHDNGRCVLINDGSRSVEMRLGPETRRRVGALHMPAMEVELIFHGFAVEELERFRSRFDLCFSRGGG